MSISRYRSTPACEHACFVRVVRNILISLEVRMSEKDREYNMNQMSDSLQECFRFLMY
jgi:hypothetical protein